MRFVTQWTEDMDARLIELMKAGETSSVAAKALGVTRNAVIGRVRRLQKWGTPIKFGENSGFRAKPGSIADQRTKKVRGGTPRKVMRPARAAEVPVAPVAPVQQTATIHTLPATLPKTFMDAVDHNLCLYFIGDPMGPSGPDMPVCGAERAQGVSPNNRYCRRHLRAAWVPVAERRRSA